MSFAFSTKVFFGDSLTDDGNLFDLTTAVSDEGFPIEDVGYNQRFTNGLVFAEYTAPLLGVDNTLNFGIGAAQALGSLTLRDEVVERELEEFLTVPLEDPALDFDINLTAQIDRFLAETAGQDRSDMSATVFIGANDYLNFEPSSPEALLIEGLGLLVEITDAVADAAQTLADEGVGQVVINGLPSGDFFPAVRSSPELAPIAGVVLGLHNLRLKNTVEELQAQGVDAVYVDIEAMTRTIIDDPLNFGITAPIDDVVVLDGNTIDPILNPAVDGIPLDQVAFFDLVHPTDTIHGVLGSFHAASLTSDVTIGNDRGSFRRFREEEDQLILAGGGTDAIGLVGGDDIAFGEAGDDFIFGAAGADIISGGADDDILFGGPDGDVLTGGTGDDVTRGGIGNDVLIDGLGSDFARGGAGDDLFIFREDAFLGGDGSLDENTFAGGFGFDTLAMLLTEDTAASYADTSATAGQEAALTALGITIQNVEDVVVLTDVAELDAFNGLARLGEADLWALV